MDEKFYALTDGEKARLREGLLAAYAVPLLDDVEDFVWEAVFHYMKDIPMYDPISKGRTKQLFDVLSGGGTGWSMKTILWERQDVGTEFELVIQRADIFTKALALGFIQGLTVKSPVDALGAALVRHWNAKYEKDLHAQGVTDARIAILLKDRVRRRFSYLEFAHPPITEEEYTWVWTKEDGRGLKGLKEGKVHFKWYHNQKQLFQVMRIPKQSYRFELDWKRADLSAFIVQTLKAFIR